MSLLLQLLQDQSHNVNARPQHHYQLINSQKHAEHQLHSKKTLFYLEFPSITSQVDSGSIMELADVTYAGDVTYAVHCFWI